MKSQYEADLLSQQSAALQRTTGLVQVFTNFQACDGEILKQISESRKVRIFIQLGKTVLSGNANFYKHLTETEFRDQVDIRILHADKDSKHLSERVANERGSHYPDWETDLEDAERRLESLQQRLQARIGAELRARTHQEGYLWRLFIFDEHTYVQPCPWPCESPHLWPLEMPHS